MHCPRCGQQQASNEMRFCSRCGFRLDGVSHLLASDGFIEQGEAQPPQHKLSLRQIGLRVWALLMAVSLVFLPIIMATGNGDEPLVSFAITFGLFLAGIFWILYFRFFEPTNQPSREKKQHAKTPVAPKPALPPSPADSVKDFASQRISTADMLQTPSVTENTTNLLNDK